MVLKSEFYFYVDLILKFQKINKIRKSIFLNIIVVMPLVLEMPINKIRKSLFKSIIVVLFQSMGAS